MREFPSLSPKEFDEIEAKVRAKLGEKLKTHRVLREEVLELIQQEATLLKYPIKDNELCAFVCKKKDRVFVYINTFIPREKQVFAAAHELYHIWYDQDKLNQTELLHDQVLENYTEDVNELKANLFAALLLVPTEVLSNEIKSRGIQKNSLKIEDIVRLMALFYVPFKTIVRRLFEIEFIDEKKMREFLTVPDRDSQAGVILVRKRLQLNDSTQDRTNEVFFENLVENAISAYNEEIINEQKLRNILSLVNQSPESMQIIELGTEGDWDSIMGDYDGDD
ncbi:ImmA/IrrE family metallo-endopeptidase [Paenibacillus sp. NRS-1782]|uniref:ImmA/IrrE family metallo-endopeptidase n=1 Tax=unclassified Paenibacillus TaxID=185978 RepID=UPI003D2CCAA9